MRFTRLGILRRRNDLSVSGSEDTGDDDNDQYNYSENHNDNYYNYNNNYNYYNDYNYHDDPGNHNHNDKHNNDQHYPRHHNVYSYEHSTKGSIGSRTTGGCERNLGMCPRRRWLLRRSVVLQCLSSLSGGYRLHWTLSQSTGLEWAQENVRLVRFALAMISHDLSVFVGRPMSTVPERPCRWCKAKHRSVPTDKTVDIHRRRTAMPFTIVLVVRIISFDVPADCSGMIWRKNVGGNLTFVVVHRRRCYLTRTNSIQHSVQRKRTGKRIKSKTLEGGGRMWA